MITLSDVINRESSFDFDRFSKDIANLSKGECEELLGNIQSEILKGGDSDVLHSCRSLVLDRIEKAKSGVYADTAENRKLGRVGQQYGGKKEITNYFGTKADLEKVAKKLDGSLKSKGFYAKVAGSGIEVYKTGDRPSLKNLQAAIHDKDYVSWGQNENNVGLRNIVESAIKQAFDSSKSSFGHPTDAQGKSKKADPKQDKVAGIKKHNSITDKTLHNTLRELALTGTLRNLKGVSPKRRGEIMDELEKRGYLEPNSINVTKKGTAWLSGLL